MKKVTLFTVATMMMFTFAFTSVGFAGTWDWTSKPAICIAFPKSKLCKKAMKKRERLKELREKGKEDKDKCPIPLPIR